MDTHDYQRLADRTVCSQQAALDRLTTSTDPQAVMKLLHSVIGLAGEIGELASAIEKHLWYGQPFDRVNFAEEIGDSLWYIAEALNALGLPMISVMLSNIAKLQARYPDKYDDQHAAEENRNRLAERAVLEESYIGDYQRTVDREQPKTRSSGPYESFEHYKRSMESLGKSVSDSYNRLCSRCRCYPVHRNSVEDVCASCR